MHAQVVVDTDIVTLFNSARGGELMGRPPTVLHPCTHTTKSEKIMLRIAPARGREAQLSTRLICFCDSNKDGGSKKCISQRGVKGREGGGEGKGGDSMIIHTYRFKEKQEMEHSLM